MFDDEDRELAAIVDGELVGKVRGVSIDLTFKHIRPPDWKVHDGRVALMFAGLLLPGDYDEEERTAELHGAARRAPNWVQLPDAFGTEGGLTRFRLEPGDSVSIARAIRYGRAKPYEDPHDGPCWLAFPKVTKSTGEEFTLTDCVELVPHDAMGPYSDYDYFGDADYEEYVAPHKVNIWKLLKRLERLIKEQGSEKRPNEWLDLSNRMLMDWVSAIDLESEFGEHWELLECASIGFYALGRAEGEKRFLPLAKQSLSTAEQRGRAQKAAALRRRELGEPTREAARQLMEKQPWLSWTACANKIANGRDPSGVRQVIAPLFPPGPDGRRQYVREDPTKDPDVLPEPL